MYFPSDHPTHPNTFKGGYEILKERGIVHNFSELRWACVQAATCHVRFNRCFMKSLLNSVEDFFTETSMLQDIATKRGHIVKMLPKFHCELNPIEQFWASLKQYLRRNCTYSLQGLKVNIPLGVANVKLQTVQRYFLRMWRFIHMYYMEAGGTRGAITLCHQKVHNEKVFPSPMYSWQCAASLGRRTGRKN